MKCPTCGSDCGSCHTPIDVKAEKLELLDKIINCIPTNWCDSLLTGKNSVLPEGYSYDPKDIERLLLAVKSRIEQLKSEIENE